MDKTALGRKLREIHKALCTQIEEKYFTALEEDVTDHIAWNRLHSIAYSNECDSSYIILIDQCCIAATRLFLGDVAG